MATSRYITNILPTIAPRLPAAPVEYNAQYIEQYSNILRLYFNGVDTTFGGLLGSPANNSGLRPGGVYLNFPYGAFSSDQSQTTTANTATLMTLNTTDFANNVSISSSKIKVQNAGIYNLQFSAQMESNDVAPQDVFIWLRQGNDGGGSADITGSTGKVGLPARKSAGNPFHSIIGWNYYLNMAADDYVQIYWSTTSANVSIQYYPASSTPTKPSTQSVVATLTFVSSVPT
jgi:hypothetical protein